ncbi:nucleotide-binding protein [Peribacillus kribbensis]|uniref:nucleotide-binding protein n=1 Tax=Peribacillus kribbensis TaxID=356658 RepID=UPI00042061E0|nr:nucleotide-binding protein [Peribacillus kribbensis]
MDQNKPKVFIGSASESMHYATAVQAALAYYAEVTPWFTGVFNAHSYTMESLEKQLNQSDFAVFIFSPDDVVKMRGSLTVNTRDNTLFEMGLFWGKLRRGRVFYLISESIPEELDGLKVDKFHLPSDLDGLSVLKYENRADQNYHAAVNVACSVIAGQIQKLGCFEEPSLLIENAELELQENYALIRFTRNLAKGLLAHPEKKYEYLFESLWNAFRPPHQFTVQGIGVWKADGTEGLRQIAGNEGRGKFYPFSINEERGEEDHILVIDSFLRSEEQVLLKDSHFDETYVICYPIASTLLITVAISGKKELSDEELDKLFLANHNLMGTINYLFGGGSV